MLKTTRHLLELIRFSHTLFALPFALLAALMAWRLPLTIEKPPRPSAMDILSQNAMHPFPDFGGGLDVPFRQYVYPQIGWREILGILLCMVMARSFAMAFNRLADRHIDATNPRTAARHLPAGILSVAQ